MLLELVAICQGLRLGWDRGFRCVLCESNSLETIRLIHSPSPQLHQFQAVIMEIKSWLSREWHVLMPHVVKEGNQSADHLAKFDASLEERLVILEETSHTIIPSLHFDHMGVIFERN